MLSLLLLGSALAGTVTGHYYGTKKILGYHITVDMVSGDPGFFSLKVTGAPGGNIDCPKEAYTLEGSTLDMPGYKTAGDCAHDQFKKASLKFKGAIYDETADTITVKSKYLFVGVTIVCQKQSSALAIVQPPVVLEDSLTGHYKGMKKVMGYHITVDMKSGDKPGIFSLKVTGAPGGNVDCEEEAYTMEGSTLDMPGYVTAGDCAHDQFKKAHLKFKGATYDETADTITVKSKYRFIGVTIVCQKQPAVVNVVPANVLAAPMASITGHYMGTKSIMGYHIKVDMQSGDTPGVFALKVTGAPSGDIDCPKEAYTLTGSTLDMPNYETAGDCAHDQFKKAKLKFKGATYDAASDTITMKSKYLFISVTIVASKQGLEIEGESMAPLQRILNRMDN